MSIIPVILSGGGGTRLWPMSTAEKPKQFLALTAAQTMFQLTVQRVCNRAIFDAPLIVANAGHAALVKDQLDAIGVTDARLLLEPCARNTAPAIALAAIAVSDPDAVLLVMPSDHVITDVPAFHGATQSALALVEQGWMVTYGIAPTGPETGYGYICMGEPLGSGLRRVDRFVEKPTRDAADAMLAQGNYSWNGGIFLFRADAYLNALAVHAPDILHAAQQAMAGAVHNGASISPDAKSFAACPADSIDYAVMEKAQQVAIIPVSMGWSDVGSWDALYDLRKQDSSGNAITGTARTRNASGNLIHADGIRISVNGVDDLIIIANGQEVMIMPRGRSQEVKDFAKD
jgi:mannose-1-phosphate guanylyltransferase